MPKEERKKTPTEVIAETSSPDIEAAFVKAWGHNPEEVSKNRLPGTTSFDEDLIQRYVSRTKHPESTIPISYIHTHPENYELRSTTNPHFRKAQTVSSLEDIKFILKEKNNTLSEISQKDNETGAVSGYLFLMKSSKTTKEQRRSRESLLNLFYLLKKSDIDQEKGESWSNYKKELTKRKNRVEDELKEKEKLTGGLGWTDKSDYLTKIEQFEKAIKYLNHLETEVYKEWKSSPHETNQKIAHEFGLRYRFAPASPEHPANVAIAKKLEQKALAVSVFAISSGVLSLLFISNNLTGNVIGLNNSSVNILGICLFAFCIGGIFLYSKTKKKYSELMKQFRKNSKKKK